MQTWYVYYDTVGKIYAVTNEKKTTGNFIETSEDSVRDFISGKKKIDNFTVNLNANSSNYFKEKLNLDSLKFCMLENFNEERVQNIDFQKYNIVIYEYLNDNYNFLKTKYLITSNEELINVESKNKLMKVITK